MNIYILPWENVSKNTPQHVNNNCLCLMRCQGDMDPFLPFVSQYSLT